MHIKQLVKIELHINTCFLFIFIFFIHGCSPKIVQPLQTQTDESNLSSGLKIISLDPLLTFERIYDETVLNPEDYNGSEINAKMIQISNNMLKEQSFKLVQPLELENREVDELFTKLQKVSSKLSVGYLTAETKEILNKIFAYDENIAILSQYLYVKVGQGGTYNAYTGAITSSNSSSLLRVSLVHCNGDVIWKNQVLLRQLPNPDNEKFTETLDILYTTFPKNKED
jgi:hypothetical protein